MREEEFNKLILSTIANLGGVNVLVDDVAEKVIPGCDSMSKDDIIFLYSRHGEAQQRYSLWSITIKRCYSFHKLKKASSIATKPKSTQKNMRFL